MKRGRTEKKGKPHWRRWGIFVYVGSELDFFLFGEKVESEWGNPQGKILILILFLKRVECRHKWSVNRDFLNHTLYGCVVGGCVKRGVFFGFWAESLYINKEICLSST